MQPFDLDLFCVVDIRCINIQVYLFIFFFFFTVYSVLSFFLSLSLVEIEILLFFPFSAIFLKLASVKVSTDCHATSSFEQCEIVKLDKKDSNTLLRM